MATKTPSKATPKRRNRQRVVDPAELWPNNLADIRKARGRSMTQARLAELISSESDHVGQTTIAAVETGRISGRRYMHRIARALDADVRDIFPYARYVTVAEAARDLAAPGVKPADLRKSGIPMVRIKGTDFVRPEDVMAANLQKRVGPSLRERLHYYLQHEGPATTAELVEEFGPYKTDADRTKRKNTIMVLLSRYPEFIADRSTYPAKWRFSQRKLTMSKNGTLPEKTKSA